MTNSHHPDYYAYLLRLWRSGTDPIWRASLEDPHTGERYYFASPQRAFAYLDAQVNQPSGNKNPEALFPNLEEPQ